MPSTSKEAFIFGECEKAFRVEIDSAAQMATKAEKYLAAAGLALSLQVVSTREMKSTGISVLAVTGTAALVLSMLLAIVSMRVRRYSTYPNGALLLDLLGAEDVSLPTAQLAVAKMYLTARENNFKINDSRARLLAIAGALLVGGFVLLVVSQLGSIGGG